MAQRAYQHPDHRAQGTGTARFRLRNSLASHPHPIRTLLQETSRVGIGPRPIPTRRWYTLRSRVPHRCQWSSRCCVRFPCRLCRRGCGCARIGRAKERGETRSSRTLSKRKGDGEPRQGGTRRERKRGQGPRDRCSRTMWARRHRSPLQDWSRRVSAFVEGGND